MAKSIARFLADIASTTGVLDGTLSTAAQTNITSVGTLSSLVIADGATIGSASDTNSITISSAGVVTLDQIPVFSAGINVSGGSIAGTLSTAAQTNITSVGTLSALGVTGEIAAGSLDISGNIDIDGTTNLDVVDIDGAVDMASTLAVGGVVTANAGVAVDNITIDGTEIDLSSGDLTIDVAGNIRLDADDAGEIRLLDGGTQYAAIKKDGNNALFQSIVADGDFIIQGIDGSSFISALTLDMSDAGTATFNSNVGIGVTPTNFANRKSLDIGLGGKIWGHTSATETGHGSNFYFDGAYKRIAAVAPTRHIQDGNGHTFSVSASGAANSTITWDDALIVNPSGYVGIGTNNPSSALHISGGNNLTSQIRFTNTAPSPDNDWTIGSYYNDQGLYFRSNDNATNVMVMLDTGNVGIGTTTPGAKLDIDGGFFRIKGDQPVGAYYYGIMYDGTNLRGTTQTNILYSGSTIAANTTVTDYAGLRIDAPSTAASGAVITNNYGIYQASSAQKNYFGGNVGIGNPSPGATLHVDPAANVTTGFGTPLIKVGGDNSWAGNGSLYSVGFGYVDSSISNKSPAEIGFLTTTNAGYTKGDLVFATRDTTGNDTPTERFRIDSSGSAGATTSNASFIVGASTGTNTLYNNTSGTAIGIFAEGNYSSCSAHYESSSDAVSGWSPFYVNKFNWQAGRDVRWMQFMVNGGSDTASITYDGTNFAIVNGSDYRLKENIVAYTGGLAKINAIGVKSFNKIDGVSSHITQEGFIAHELQEVIPLAVIGEKDAMKVDESGETVPDYQTVNRETLIPYLVSAIQEQQTLIEALTTRLTALENN